MEFSQFCHTPNPVFENRNKSYGAYLMRKIYEKRVLTSALLGITFFSLAVAGPVLYEKFRDKSAEKKEKEKVVELKAIEPPPMDPKTPPPPELPPPPPPKVSTIKFIPPEVAKDEEVQEEMVEQKELEDKVIATKTEEGDPNVNPDDVIVEDAAPKTTEVIGTKQEDEVFLIVEQQPEFPGGMQAMYKWLGKNLKYPSQAKRMGVEGRVFVSFVVGKDGSIRDIQVLKGIGAGCDEEAQRVIQSMPAWNPGKQGGRPVSVKYNLPLVFKLEQ
jgi:periplasmic protein TonB